MRIRALIPILLLTAFSLAADEVPRAQVRDVAERQEGRHYLLQSEHVLRADEKAALAATGVAVGRALPGNRYIVKMVLNAIAAGDPRVHSVQAFNAEDKITGRARHAAATATTAHLQVLFHDDVTFDEAVATLASVGGTLEEPLTVDFAWPKRLDARVPSANLTLLAADDRVFAIYGPMMKPHSLNQAGATLSHVPPLYAAPYNLDGSGIVLSSFELGEAQTAHPEFTGRATSHFGSDKGSSEDADHATHTSGTIMAAGVNPSNPQSVEAKGMSPAAKIELFDARATNLFTQKATLHKDFGIIADNNSWGYQLGWQQDPSSGTWVWYDNINYLGGYDDQIAAVLDKDSLTNGTLEVFSAGNDAQNNNLAMNALTGFAQHEHPDDATGNPLTDEVFCYSQNGSGTDCPTPPCTAGMSTKATDDNGQPLAHCETVKHPTYGPFTTIGITGSSKDVVSVGAVSLSESIATFSSRGPARDGRVKPELVADGIGVLSTVQGSTYGSKSGTSMAAPVVTGIAGLIAQQWQRTFGGQAPTPQQLKTVLIAGADDLGNPGPDYTYGFGLVNAQASADLIVADGGNGARIHNDTITQGQTADLPMTVSATENLRVVLAWADPAVVLPANTLASGATLLNDLDLKVSGPAGTILPYVLDVNNPQNPATHGVNTVDNVEEVEIPNAAPGSYHVLITGSHIASGTSQDYVVVANAALGRSAAQCGDPFEPNDTPDTAYGNLASTQLIAAKSCSQTDLDFYKFVVSFSGPVSVTLTATDTPLSLTLSGVGNPQTVAVAPGQTQTLSVTVGSGFKQPISPVTFLVEVQPTAAPGASASYRLTPSYPTVVPARRAAVHH